MLDTDVFVCGGGPAGLAAAIACRMAGLEVVVADCSAPPIDKACGEGLLPDALHALHCLGVELDETRTAPFRGIRFLEGEAIAEAKFVSGVARGVRRTHLHEALQRRAEQLGAVLLWRTQVRSLKQHTGAEPPETAGVVAQTTAGEVHARWCVGADGLQSRIRLWAGLDQGAPESRRIGLRSHYRVAPWSDFVEVSWGKTGEAYVTPMGPDEISVAVVSRRKFGSLAGALEEFPALARRLAGAQRTSSERGAATFHRRMPKVTAGCVALVGDASGSLDAVTGAGLGLAFEQALALAEAISAGELSRYQQAHRTICNRPFWIGRGLLLLDRSAVLRRLTLAAFQQAPWTFQRMLQLHSGGGAARSAAFRRAELEAAANY